MNEEELKKLAEILGVELDVAKEFANGLTSSGLATLVNNLQNNNPSDIHAMFNDYVEHGVSESTLSEDDRAYDIEMEYDELRKSGKSHDGAINQIMHDFNIDSEQEVYNILKSPITEFIGEFDEQINETFKKLELLKKESKQLGGNIFKGLSSDQINQIISKSKSYMASILSKFKNMTPAQSADAHAKMRGFETQGIVEQELDTETMQDRLIENEICVVFEAMKNKWKKRSYWRKRFKNKGLGTVSREGFDHDAKLDPHNKIVVDDYGTITVKETNVVSLKDYIVKHSKK